MLEMRPNCECCDTDLDPSGEDARICSFECTFCATCADGVLKGKCPNCGGGLVPRPARAADKLAKFPASTRRRGAKAMSYQPAEEEPGEVELDELISTMPGPIRRQFFNGGYIDVVALAAWIWRDGKFVGWNDKPVRTLSGGNAIVPRLLRDHWLKRSGK